MKLEGIMNSRLNREDLLEEESIDLSELLKAILKYCKLIIIMCISFAFIGFLGRNC